MPLKSITSRENPAYRSLLALAESRQARRETDRTLLDGEHLLADALQAGLVPRQLVFDAEQPEAAAWADRLPGVPSIVLPASLFRKLSPVATPSGILAEIDIPRRAVPLADCRFVMLLEDIQEPGNLGALLRTAAGAGVDAVFLSRGCAEAWSPKSLRGGQGGHFRLDIVEGADLAAVIQAFGGAVHAAALGAGRTLYDLPLAGRTGFLFGNEGAGLSAPLLELAEPFAIPMPGAIESLNVAAAAAICLFERVRQDLAKES